jgi:hypothetical protein
MRSDVSRTIFFAIRCSCDRWIGPPSLFELRRGSLRYGRFAEPKPAQPAKAGGARRDRTDDLMLAKHALSQLSYGPEPEDECSLARRAEARVSQPAFARWATAALTRCASEGWWAWEDLNFRPHAYQARALTN